MDNIDIFNDSAIILDNKVPNKIITWITILIILLILFIGISFINFNVYRSSVGVFHNNTIEVNIHDFPITKSNKIYINKKLYKYKLINISDDKVILSINLDEYLKIENNILNINILKNRTSLFKMFIQKWKEVFFNDNNE